MAIDSKECSITLSGATSVLRGDNFETLVKAKPIEHTDYQPIYYTNESFEPIKQLRWTIVGSILLLSGLLIYAKK